MTATNYCDQLSRGQRRTAIAKQFQDKRSRRDANLRIGDLAIYWRFKLWPLRVEFSIKTAPLGVTSELEDDMIRLAQRYHDIWYWHRGGQVWDRTMRRFRNPLYRWARAVTAAFRAPMEPPAVFGVMEFVRPDRDEP